MIYRVKGFSVVYEVDIFSGILYLFYDQMSVRSLISGSSVFSKSNLYIWKFSVHILLKPNLKDFEHYFLACEMTAVAQLFEHSWASLIVQLVKNCLQCRRPQFDSWVRKMHWRRDRLPTPVFLGFPCDLAGKEYVCKTSWRRESLPTPVLWPREFHRLDSPWGCKESDSTEQLSLSHSLALPFFGTGMKTDIYQSCDHSWIFQICCHVDYNTLTASSFRIWNSSAAILPPLPTSS